MDAQTPNPILERPVAPVGRRSRLGRAVMIVLCLLVVAAMAATIWLWPARNKDAPNRRAAFAQTVPVLVATAERRDMPIMLDGLGTVQALNTVTVKTVVDGPLVSVNFTEGQMVRKGDLLARVDPRNYQAAYDQVVAKKAQDEALLANARADLTRYQKLVSNNYTSAQQADTQKALVAQYEAQTRQDQAQIDAARTNLDYTSILSPLDGRTGVRLVDQGNIVHASDPTGLVVITQLQPLFVVFTLPQQSLPAVAKAMAAGQATVVATPQGGSRSAVLDTGVLTVLDNQVDPTTGTIKMKARFPNQENRLWPGGFVGVRLRVDTEANAVVVPPSAIQRGPRGAFVYVVGDDKTATRQAIKTGYEDERYAIVAEGLAGGEKVVTDGASRLTDGAKVTIAEPASDAPPPRRERPSAPGAPRRPTGG